MSFLFLFSVFLSMLKIDRPPHQFYNFAIRESYVLGNFEYWICAKGNIRSSTELRKFLPYLLILCVYHCISYIQRCQLVIIDLRYTFIFAIVHSTFTIHYTLLIVFGTEVKKFPSLKGALDCLCKWNKKALAFVYILIEYILFVVCKFNDKNHNKTNKDTAKLQTLYQNKAKVR